MDKKHFEYFAGSAEDFMFFSYSFVNQHGKPISDLNTKFEMKFEKGAEVSLSDVDPGHAFPSLRGKVISATQRLTYVEAGFVRSYYTVKLKIDYKKQIAFTDENQQAYKRFYQGGLIE